MADGFYRLSRIEKLTSSISTFQLKSEGNNVSLVGLFLAMVLMENILFRGWIGERLRVGVLLSGQFLGRHS